MQKSIYHKNFFLELDLVIQVYNAPPLKRWSQGYLVSSRLDWAVRPGLKKHHNHHTQKKNQEQK